MRHANHIKRPVPRKKGRVLKTLSARAWVQVTLAIRQLAAATA
jgi:hypothetical protein